MFDLWSKAQIGFEADIPQIILGSFECEEQEAKDNAMEFLEGNSIFNETSGTFRDAWMDVNPENEGYTYPSWDPEHRADRILYREEIRPVKCDVMGYS